MTGCSASSGEIYSGIFSSPKADTPRTLKIKMLWYATMARPLSETMVGNGLFKVTVRGHQPDGRTYDEVGYVSLVDRQGTTLGPHAYKNALMKCHTVAKRRLSYCANARPTSSARPALAR